MSRSPYGTPCGRNGDISRSCKDITRSNNATTRSNNAITRSDNVITRSDNAITRSDNAMSVIGDSPSDPKNELNGFC